MSFSAPALNTADPARTFGPRATELLLRVARERIPLQGSIELTHRCNLACKHCYVNLPAADRGAQRREMTTAQVFALVDELVELGLLHITLTGGEPLLRPDFEEIYRYLHGKGVLVHVYTNATLITDKVIALWTELPPTRVEVTQYGFTAETYDDITDTGAGQYRRFARGLERLRAAGVELTLKAMALRDNAHEIPAIIDWALAQGIDFRYDTSISPRIDGGRGPLTQRISPEENARIDIYEAERRKGLVDAACATGGSKSDDLYRCGAGLNNFVIDPYGNLHLCELSRTLRWNVVERGFATGWFEGIPAKRKQKRAHDLGCGTCATSAGCTNCVGMAELEGLLPEDGNPYFCRVTDARNELLLGAGRPTPNGLVRLRLGRDHQAAGVL